MKEIIKDGLKNFLFMAVLLGLVAFAVFATDYTFKVIGVSNDSKAVTLVDWNNMTLRVENKAWFDNCKLNNTDIAGLNCSDLSYDNYVARRVREIADEDARIREYRSIDVVSLKQENDRLKDCILTSDSFESVKNCVNR